MGNSRSLSVYEKLHIPNTSILVSISPRVGRKRSFSFILVDLDHFIFFFVLYPFKHKWDWAIQLFKFSWDSFGQFFYVPEEPRAKLGLIGHLFI